MEEVKIKADRREVIGKQVKALRREGKLPANVYGKTIGSIPVTLDYREVSRFLDLVSPSTLVIVNVEGDEHYTLVREKQRDPIQGKLRHVDFQAVSLTETVRANVNIHLIGEAPAVETYHAVLVTSLEQLEVECLPRDLVDRIDVDITTLHEIGDSLAVRDLVLPKGIVVLNDLSETVVVATAQVAEPEVEEEELEEVGELEPELIERGKREVEEEKEEES
jgi:large subunit ribosomal protein L25